MSLFSASVVGFSVAGVLHFFGFILLYRAPMKLINQRLILLNLSAAECMNSLLKVVEWVRREGLAHSDEDIQGSPYCYVESFLSFSSTLSVKFLMFYLIVDRLVDIHLNMVCTADFNKSIIMKIFGVVWLLAAVLGAVLDVGFKCKEDSPFLYYVFFGLDVLIFVLCIATYRYFYTKVRSRSQWRKVSRKFLIPFFMMLTYVVFNITSTTIITVTKFMDDTSKTVQNTLPYGNTLPYVAQCLIFTGWIFHAIIYISLQKQVRNLITKNLHTRFKNSMGKESAIALISVEVIPNVNKCEIEQPPDLRDAGSQDSPASLVNVKDQKENLSKGTLNEAMDGLE